MVKNNVRKTAQVKKVRDNKEKAKEILDRHKKAFDELAK